MSEPVVTGRHEAALEELKWLWQALCEEIANKPGVCYAETRAYQLRQTREATSLPKEKEDE